MVSDKRKAYLRAWYARTKEARKAKMLEWRNKNRERLREYVNRKRRENPDIRRKERERNREKIRAKKRADYLKDGGARAKLKAKLWKAQNPERARELQSMWRSNNPDRHKASKRKHYERKKSNPHGAISIRMGRAVYLALRHKGGKRKCRWEKVLGFTAEQLRAHLESKFQPGMSWEAYLRGDIHTDHIRPISWFKYDSMDHPDFKKCWCLDNLQPLWAKDNITKQARWCG